MPFNSWKHEERNRHRDRKMYLVKVLCRLTEYRSDIVTFETDRIDT